MMMSSTLGDATEERHFHCIPKGQASRVGPTLVHIAQCQPRDGAASAAGDTMGHSCLV